MCTSEYHEPTHIVQQPYGGWWLFCDCQEERCGNIGARNADDVERWAGDFESMWIQPCLSFK